MKRLLLLLTGLLCLPPAYAGEEPKAPGIDADTAFAAVGIYRDGRPKPMDSAARHYLLEFSGRSKLGDESASDWFARLLFDPDSTASDPSSATWSMRRPVTSGSSASTAAVPTAAAQSSATSAR